MAYMRGDYYIWTDTSELHIWAADGYDAWDRASWHVREDGEVRPEHKKNGQNSAGGVCIPQEVADEYVVMRLAQMIKDGIVSDVIDRATDPEGRADNFGNRFLRQYSERLKRALDEVKTDPELAVASAR